MTHLPIYDSLTDSLTDHDSRTNMTHEPTWLTYRYMTHLLTHLLIMTHEPTWLTNQYDSLTDIWLTYRLIYWSWLTNQHDSRTNMTHLLIYDSLTDLHGALNGPTGKFVALIILETHSWHIHTRDVTHLYMCCRNQLPHRQVCESHVTNRCVWDSPIDVFDAFNSSHQQQDQIKSLKC